MSSVDIWMPTTINTSNNFKYFSNISNNKYLIFKFLIKYNILRLKFENRTECHIDWLSKCVNNITLLLSFIMYVLNRDNCGYSCLLLKTKCHLWCQDCGIWYISLMVRNNLNSFSTKNIVNT